MKIKDNCWVYILTDKKRSLYEIELTGNIEERIDELKKTTDSGAGAKELVFARYFNDTLAALGYKIVLSKLSRKSLESVIRKDREEYERAKI